MTKLDGWVLDNISLTFLVSSPVSYPNFANFSVCISNLLSQFIHPKILWDCNSLWFACHAKDETNFGLLKLPVIHMPQRTKALVFCNILHYFYKLGTSMATYTTFYKRNFDSYPSLYLDCERFEKDFLSAFILLCLLFVPYLILMLFFGLYLVQKSGMHFLPMCAFYITWSR